MTVDFRLELLMKCDAEEVTWICNHNALNLFLDWNISHISKQALVISVNQKTPSDTVDFPEELWSVENEFSTDIITE